MILRTSSTVALVVVGMLTAVASAQQVFHDNFDFGLHLDKLEGHAANTGQVWGAPIFGVADAVISNHVGQTGSLGASISSDPRTVGTQVPLDLPANLNADVDADGNITGGLWTFSVDFHKGNTSGMQLGLNTTGVTRGGHPNWGWKVTGDCAPCIETQAIFSTHRETAVQYEIGDLHADILIDFTAREQTIEWYDPTAPADPGRSGVDGPVPFGTGAAADFSINTIWYAGSGGQGANGVDNVELWYGLRPDTVDPPPPADFTWFMDGTESWTTATNWSPAIVPGDLGRVNYLNHTATFGDVILSPRTIFTDTAVSVRAITFDNSNTYAVAGPGSVNLVQGTSSGSPPTAITVNQGSHQFQAIVNLLNDTTVDVDSGATLVFNNALNLNSNSLTKTGDGEVAIRNDLITGGGTISLQQGIVSGNGTIGGDVNNSGGTLSPGDSAGLTTVVPEPTAGLLALLGSLGIAAYVSRCRNLKVRSMIMRTSSTVAAALIVVGMLTTVTSAQQVFFDDFDSGGAMEGANLQGHVANTGQTWGAPVFGAIDAVISSGAGQNGSLGASISSDPPSTGLQVPLDLAPNEFPEVNQGGFITDGLWTFSFDYHRDMESGGLQIGVNNTGVGAPHHPNWGWKTDLNEGCDKCIQTQAIYNDNETGNSHNTTIGYLTGDLHLDVVLDFTEKTQTLIWYDPTDPTNPARSGSEDTGSFKDDAGVFTINSIWLAGSSGDQVNGVDNVELYRGLNPKVKLPAPPTDFSWAKNDSGIWEIPNNWNPSGGGPPGGPGTISPLNHTATFSNAISSPRTVGVDTAVSVRAITFDNSNTYAVAGPGSVNLVQGISSGSPPTAITVNQGSHQFQAIVNLLNDTTVDVDSGATLVFNNALNLNSNSLTKTGDGEVAIRNDLITGSGTISLQQGTVSGNGTIGGDVNNDGGTISPGNSVGLTSAVPEPTAGLLALLGSLGIAAYVSRCRN